MDLLPPASGLTATSLVILGHFTLRDWTPYDLAKQMRRNIRYFFPRAESQVYAEPPRLAARGLLLARTETAGRRQRSVYSITPAGREVLRHWLAGDVARGPVLEVEALARVLLARAGSTADLARSVASIGAEGRAMADVADMIAAEYLEGRHPFQADMVHRALLHDFLTRFAVLMEDWSARALARIAAWEEEDAEARTEAARRMIAEANAQRRRPPPDDGT